LYWWTSLRKGKKSLLFCEQKRSKKNFDFSDVTLPVSHPPEGEQKFFWFFFSKKELLPFYLPWST